MSHPQFEGAPKEAYDSGSPSSGRGCFFYGCLIAVILLLIGLALGGAAFYTAYSYYNRMVEDYTSTAPDALPQVTMSDEDRKALKERFEAFSKAADDGKSAEIVLNSDDVNALIEESPDWKGKVYVDLKDDAVNARVSVPLEKTGLPRTQGRYLVASGTLKVTVISGVLDVRAQKLEVKGKPLPDAFLNSFSNENLAKESNRNPDQSSKIRKIESLVVKNGKVRLKTKAKDAEDEAVEQKRIEDKEKKDAETKGKADADPKPEGAEKPRPDGEKPVEPKDKSSADAEPKAKEPEKSKPEGEKPVEKEAAKSAA